MVGDGGVVEGTCSVGSAVGVGDADVAEAEGVVEGEGAGGSNDEALADAEGDAVLSSDAGVCSSPVLADGPADIVAVAGGWFACATPGVAVGLRWGVVGDGVGLASASLRNGGGVTASLISSGASQAANTPTSIASG